MVDREGECTAIVQWKFIDASTPREKKRIRTETTALACKPCGKKHLKCDGIQPVCGRCVKGNEACFYIAKRRKRKSPDTTSSDSASTDFDSAPMQSNVASMKTELLLENHLANSFGFSSYIQLYEDHVNAFAFQGEGEVDHAYKYAENYPLIASLGCQGKFQDISDSRKRMFMNTVLSTGAHIMGNHLISERHLMRELYNDSHLLVAATHSLFSHRYTLQGDVEKAGRANSLAFRILGYLVRMRPNDRSKDGIQTATQYLRCLVNDIEMAPSTGTVYESLRKILTLSDQLNILPSARTSTKLFCENTMLRLDAFTAPTEYLLQYTQKLEDTMAGVPELFKVRPTIAHRLSMATRRYLAVIHLGAGHAMDALSCADAVLAHANQLGSEYYDIYMVKGLFCAGQVYTHIGISQKQREIIEFLQRLSGTLPLAASVLSRLIQLDEQVRSNRQQTSVQIGWTWELMPLPTKLPRLHIEPTRPEIGVAPHPTGQVTYCSSTKSSAPPPPSRSKEPPVLLENTPSFAFF